MYSQDKTSNINQTNCGSSGIDSKIANLRISCSDKLKLSDLQVTSTQSRSGSTNCSTYGNAETVRKLSSSSRSKSSNKVENNFSKTEELNNTTIVLSPNNYNYHYNYNYNIVDPIDMQNGQTNQTKKNNLTSLEIQNEADFAAKSEQELATLISPSILTTSNFQSPTSHEVLPKNEIDPSFLKSPIGVLSPSDMSKGNFVFSNQNLVEKSTKIPVKSSNHLAPNYNSKDLSPFPNSSSKSGRFSSVTVKSQKEKIKPATTQIIQGIPLFMKNKKLSVRENNRNSNNNRNCRTQNELKIQTMNLQKSKTINEISDNSTQLTTNSTNLPMYSPGGNVSSTGSSYCKQNQNANNQTPILNSFENNFEPNNKNQNSIIDIINKTDLDNNMIKKMIVNQHGSRFLQNQFGMIYQQQNMKINGENIIELKFLNSIWDCVYDLSTNVYANWVIQKLIEKTQNVNILLYITNEISKKFVQCSLNIYGCRVVQQIIKKWFNFYQISLTNKLNFIINNSNNNLSYKNPDYYLLIIKIFIDNSRNNVSHLLFNKNGHHVIKNSLVYQAEIFQNNQIILRALQNFNNISQNSPDSSENPNPLQNLLENINYNQFYTLKQNLDILICKQNFCQMIIEELSLNCDKIVSDQYGCEIIELLLKKFDWNQHLYSLFFYTLKNLHNISTNKFGNYIIQDIIDHKLSDHDSNFNSNLYFQNTYIEQNCVNTTQILAEIRRKLCYSIGTLAFDKYASNIIEKLVCMAKPHEFNIILHILDQSDSLVSSMIDHKFANYVIQTLIQASKQISPLYIQNNLNNNTQIVTPFQTVLKIIKSKVLDRLLHLKYGHTIKNLMQYQTF